MFRQIPDYNSYLTYIYVQLASQVTIDVRFGAGLALKNNIALVGADQYVKEEVIKVIADSNLVMRRSCGIDNIYSIKYTQLDSIYSTNQLIKHFTHYFLNY
jgi:hypothetical protein